VKIKKLTNAVVVTFSTAEVGDLLGVLERVETRWRPLAKRELALVLKLAGLSESIVGRRSLSSPTDDPCALSDYEATARAVRGIWQAVRV
jgi:hypothetical protein